jgi:hypothetical protein
LKAIAQREGNGKNEKENGWFILFFLVVSSNIKASLGVRRRDEKHIFASSSTQYYLYRAWAQQQNKALAGVKRTKRKNRAFELKGIHVII